MKSVWAKMEFHMKIGIAQINTTVGDLAGNLSLMLQAYEKLARQGAELIVFPELVVCGYPPLDLLQKQRFIKDCLDAGEEFASKTTVPALVGCPIPSRHPLPFNAALLCENGKIANSFHKQLLPTYDVFDESRYFTPGVHTNCVKLGGVKVSITICEDIWVDPSNNRYGIDPVDDLSKESPDLMINLSASPWQRGKNDLRLEYLKKAANRLDCPVVYCNSIGGNDELIFDGYSRAISANGECKFQLKGFETDSSVVETNSLETKTAITHKEEEISEINKALVLGLRDYTHKSGFKKAVIGLSGGIDSAVTAAIAAEALGPENVLGVSLPSEISSQHSKDDAKDLAQNLGIQYESIPIAPTVDAVEGSLSKMFEGQQIDVTEENIQARSRGIILMALSNKFGSILLTTGNKSEVAVGYCTLYGDMAGGLAVLSDVFKTAVYDLARFMNKEREVIPISTIDKPPSAELRPDQKDEDSLPPYPVLDSILRMYVEEHMTRRQITEEGYEEGIVLDVANKVDRNEYKRKQAPPGLKVTPLAFGIGRRIPIVQKYTG